jgi:hypothetical protein
VPVDHLPVGDQLRAAEGVVGVVEVQAHQLVVVQQPRVVRVRAQVGCLIPGQVADVLTGGDVEPTDRDPLAGVVRQRSRDDPDALPLLTGGVVVAEPVQPGVMLYVVVRLAGQEPPERFSPDAAVVAVADLEPARRRRAA